MLRVKNSAHEHGVILVSIVDGFESMHPEGIEISSLLDLPMHANFQQAMRVEGKSITVNLQAAKSIAHEMRRARRAVEFLPHDDVIAKRIPEKEHDAEVERVKIREKYALMQDAIDGATTAEAISAAVA